MESCWADRDSPSIYNPYAVGRVIDRYAPLQRAAPDSYEDELKDEVTLSAIFKMITAKLEAASQAARESGEAVDKLVADREHRKRKDAARYAA